MNRLQIAATPSAPACARALVAHTLASWLLADLVEDACVIVSELVSNAIREAGGRRVAPTREELAAGTGFIGAQLRVAGPQCFIEVWDPDPPPEPRSCPEEQPDGGLRERGRGLSIVRALSRGTGVSRFSGGGKIVWASMAVSDMPRTDGPRIAPLPAPPGARRAAGDPGPRPERPSRCDLALLHHADSGELRHLRDPRVGRIEYSYASLVARRPHGVG